MSGVSQKKKCKVTKQKIKNINGINILIMFT